MIGQVLLRPVDGDPNFFWVPQFTTPDVAGVVFGGFYAGRYLASQPNARNEGSIGGGRYGDNPDVADNTAVGTVAPKTLKGKPAWRYINLLEARKTCANLGPGYHLMTRFEWASLAFWAKMNNTQPRGNNRNSNPPSDVNVPTETAQLDLACNARNAGWYASLTGTGPATWNHNWLSSGVSDLNGNMWEWNDGLLLQQTTGYPYVLASLQVSLARAPYGKSTGVAAGSLSDSAKSWVAEEFLDGGGTIYIYDAAGTLHQVKTSSPANTGTAINLQASGTTPAAGPYTILRLVSTNITTGMSSGTRILTLRDTDASLKPFALPATSNSSGAAAYGTDAYYFDLGSLRATLAGGSWYIGSYAGVFALNLNDSPSYTYGSVGLRVARAI